MFLDEKALEELYNISCSSMDDLFSSIVEKAQCILGASKIAIFFNQPVEGRNLYCHRFASEQEAYSCAANKRAEAIWHKFILEDNGFIYYNGRKKVFLSCLCQKNR